LAKLVCSKTTEALHLEIPISKGTTSRTGEWGRSILGSQSGKHHRATEDKNGLGVATEGLILLSGYP